MPLGRLSRTQRRNSNTGESVESIVQKKARNWLIPFMFSPVLFLLTIRFFFQTEIRTIIDFVSSVQLANWHNINFLMYLFYAVVSSGAAWAIVNWYAVKLYNNATRQKPYSKRIPGLFALTFTVQLIILIVFLAIGAIRDGDGLQIAAIMFHLKRLGVYFIAMILIAGGAIATLEPSNRRRNP